MLSTEYGGARLTHWTGNMSAHSPQVTVWSFLRNGHGAAGQKMKLYLSLSIDAAGRCAFFPRITLSLSASTERKETPAGKQDSSSTAYLVSVVPWRLMSSCIKIGRHVQEGNSLQANGILCF